MVDKKKQSPRINGIKYHVVIAESKLKYRVSVYEFFATRRKSNEIVTNKVWKRPWIFFGADTTNIEKLIQKTVNEAVCIHEDKVEKQEQFEDRISEAIDQVRTVHEQ